MERTRLPRRIAPGAGSHKEDDGSKSLAAPLVDIILVLLIIFMAGEPPAREVGGWGKEEMSHFIPNKIKNNFVQHFQAPPRTVFPLLCPVREYEWVEPWRCEMLHSNSGMAEKNCVFRTRAPGESADDVWVISHYEPNTRIEFVRVNGLRVMTLGITLTDNGDGTTQASNEQLLIGLNEEGNQLLQNMACSFSLEMRMGEAMLNHYLTTGKRLPLQEAVAAASIQT